MIGVFLPLLLFVVTATYSDVSIVKVIAYDFVCWWCYVSFILQLCLFLSYVMLLCESVLWCCGVKMISKINKNNKSKL